MQNNNENKKDETNIIVEHNNDTYNASVNTKETQDNEEILEPEVLDEASYESARAQRKFDSFGQADGSGQNYSSAQSNTTGQSHGAHEANQNSYTYYVRTGNAGKSQGSNPFFRTYAINSPQNNSCLPSFVSLFLVLLVLFQFGFLAMLGFLFFLFVGKAISFMVIFKNLVNGKLVPPILLDCVVWILSFLLVAWLS